MSTLRSLFRPVLLSAFAFALLALSQGVANADPVTFSTAGTFSGSGTNTVTFFCGMGCTTTVTFAGTLNSVNTPAGSNFGDILVMSTAAPGAAFPFPPQTFTLTFTQIAPPGGPASLVGTLSGTLGFNSGVATLTFSTTSTAIGDFVYTVNPSYTIALPSTGSGGSAGTGTTTIQGTVLGSGPRGGDVPEPGTMILLGTGLLGVAGAVRRKFKDRT